MVVPFPIACGSVSFARGPDLRMRELESERLGRGNNAGPLDLGVFGYSHMLGGYAGGQAEYARVPFADVDPLKVPST